MRSAVVMAVMLATAVAAAAQFAAATTGGSLELQVASAAGLGRDAVPAIEFVWQPGLVLSEARHRVDAECRRRGRLGASPGAKNRVVFDLALTPIASGIETDLGRQRRKLGRDGIQRAPASWQGADLSRVAAEGGGDGVLVRLEISVRGDLDFGDTVSCTCRVSEQGRGIASGSVPRQR